MACHHVLDGCATRHLRQVGKPLPKGEKADGAIQFEKVDELLDTMRKAGVTKVLLLSQQKTN